MHYRSSKNKF